MFVQLIITIGMHLASQLLFVALQTFGWSPVVINMLLETEDCKNAVLDIAQTYAEYLDLGKGREA